MWGCGGVGDYPVTASGSTATASLWFLAIFARIDAQVPFVYFQF